MAPNPHRPKRFVPDPGWGRLRGLATPLLEDLCEQTDWTVTLGVLDIAQVLLLARASPGRADQMTHQTSVLPGARLPAYCTSIGKVLLAYLPEKQLKGWFDSVDLYPFTNKTITNKSELRDALATIARSGIADSDGEYQLGEVSLAISVGPDEEAPIAAVMISLTEAISLTALREQCLRPLVFTTQRICELWEFPDETPLINAEAEAEQETEPGAGTR
jgi:IclR family transcriptional regulator, pca regulon regulatory protein